MKKCIFYLPYELDEKGNGARMMRPRKMIEAFWAIGYDVFVIQGYSKERRERIKELKKTISDGAKYDFMYTESHTEPTLLTDPHHMPTHPFLDFGFFRYVKSKGIKIGLFYCDIYWKFDEYGVHLPGWKRASAIMNYKHDIKQYKKYLDRFYVPCKVMCRYIDEKRLVDISSELPPAADNKDVPEKTRNDGDPIHIFYVGGLGGHYQIVELFKAVAANDRFELTVCCREKEWEKEKGQYLEYLSDRIRVVHKNASELAPYYAEADICSLLFRADEYREMAMPFKAFEYLAYEKPVMSTRGTAIGSFVEENGLGWNIDYSEENISAVLKRLIDDPSEIREKIENCKEAKKHNLWINRAQKVAADLSD